MCAIIPSLSHDPDETQGFMHAKQTLYMFHMSHILSLKFLPKGTPKVNSGEAGVVGLILHGRKGMQILLIAVEGPAVGAGQTWL